MLTFVIAILVTFYDVKGRVKFVIMEYHIYWQDCLILSPGNHSFVYYPCQLPDVLPFIPPLSHLSFTLAFPSELISFPSSALFFFPFSVLLSLPTPVMLGID